MTDTHTPSGLALADPPLEPDVADALFDEFDLMDPKDVPPDADDSKHQSKIDALEFAPVTIAARGVNPSGLSQAQRIRARTLACQAMALVLAHPAEVHYTQGAQRWEGIRSGDRAWKGQFPKHGDCSSTDTWALWCGLTHFKRFRHVDLVNGLYWTAGFTGTMLRHGRSVRGQTLQRADQVLYGNGWPGEHVAFYIGGGLVISHGGEGGPFKLSMHYRGDIIDVRRYI